MYWLSLKKFSECLRLVSLGSLLVSLDDVFVLFFWWFHAEVNWLSSNQNLVIIGGHLIFLDVFL